MKATTSLWEDTLWQNCDIAIIGGGFLGMWTALRLKESSPHLQIHIYERDTFGLGASSRNAGFSCFGTVGELVSDSHTSSFEQAASVVADRYNGLQDILQFARTYGINIDYEPSGGFEMLKEHEMDALRVHLPVVNEVLENTLGISGIFHTATMSELDLPFNSTYSMIVNPHEGGVNSARILDGLEQVVQKLGVRVFHGMSVKTIEGNTLKLDNGLREFETKANTVIVAMNSFANQLIDVNVVPGRGQIIWCDNLDLKFKGIFHFDEGFYYFRTVGDNQLIMGGARNLDMHTEESHDFCANEKIINHLLDFVHNELNIKNFSIKKNWQGIMGFTPDKQPVIKEISPNVWHLHACNGMGVAMTPTIARRFSDMFFA
jgi:gamma-glutamylputrescine oxidase